MASLPHALIYGQVYKLNIREHSMSICLLVFGPNGYSRYIWVYCDRFRGIVQGEYLRIQGTFDGDILTPAFWYNGGQSNAEIHSVSEQTAKTSYCQFTLDCTIKGSGCDEYYYYNTMYFAPIREPYQDDDNNWHEFYSKFKYFKFILRGDAVRGFYSYRVGHREWLRFRGEYAPNDNFLVSKID